MPTESIPTNSPLVEAGKATEANRFYKPELDVLRCLAFVFVFFTHSRPYIGGVGVMPDLLRAFFESLRFGVCIFFLLSSYLITELLRKERLATGTIHVRAFYVRRILRIWPLYFVSLFAYYKLWPLVFPKDEVQFGRILSFLMLAGNWYAGRYGFSTNPMSPLWSISLEEQFYLFWTSLAKWGGEKILFYLSLLLFPVAWVAIWWLTRMHATPTVTIWVNSFVQFQFFAVGALLALGLKGRAVHFRPVLRFATFVGGLALWVLAIDLLHLQDRASSSNPLWAIAGYSCIALGGAVIFLSLLGVSAQSLPSSLIYLGKISYGLYVFHLAALISVNATSDWADTKSYWLKHHHAMLYAGREAIAMALTILVAHLSYRYLEKPFLKLKERFTAVKSRVA